MKRTIYLLAAVGLALAALPAVAQFQNQAGGAAWEGKALRMAAIQQEPKVSRVLLLTLVADEARADHVKLAKAVPDALAEYLVKNGLAQAAPRSARSFALGEYGLPKLDSPDEVTKLAHETQTDSLVYGDVSLVGDATRVRLVLAETGTQTFYPPIAVYVTDPAAVAPIQALVCRAMRSLLKAEDLTKELKASWQEPEAGKLRFEARPNVACVAAGQPATLFVRFEFAAGDFNTSNRSPLNVALVLDRSGSMSGEKIEQAKRAAIRVVEGLRKTDRLSFVIYDDQIDTLIPNRPCTDPREIMDLIKTVSAGNTTNLGGGLERGYEEARKGLDGEFVNRTILLSDGLANRGETRAEVLASWARKQYARDLSTSTIGIGTDYDAALMRDIAVAGNGGYYYVQTPDSINDIITREFGALFSTVAEGPRLRFQLLPGAKLETVFGFEVKENGASHLLDVPTLRSRDRKYLIAKLSLPALAVGEHPLVQASIEYQDALNAGKPASMATVLSIRAADKPTADDVNWDVHLDAEELATADVMARIAARLDKGDRAGAIALIHGRILELAQTSLQTLDLRSQVQCNILDGLAQLCEHGDGPADLRYAANNAQSIAYGGLGGNMNYQGLGAMRGAAAAEAAGAMKAGAFGGQRQQ
jgi:Ca-activated chloride channel family protein